MLDRMLPVQSKIAVLQQLKHELTQAMGKSEGETQYYMALAKYDVKHANELAKNTVNSRACAKEIWYLLHPEPVTA